MRQLNFNKPATAIELWVRAQSDLPAPNGQSIPVVAVQDPNNPTRVMFRMADDAGPTGTGLNLRVRANGYKEWAGRDVIPPPGGFVEALTSIELEPSVAPFPPGVKRAPLGPPVTCGSCPSEYSYDKVLPFTPPAGPMRDFMRANAWAVEFPLGFLPYVPEGSSEHPERLQTAYLYKYDRALWPEIFRTYAACGLTHWVLWWPNARADGMSRADFIDMCHTIQAAGFWTNIGLVSKDKDPRDMSPYNWKVYLDADYYTFLDAGAGDEYAVWEWDLFNVPGAPTIEILSHWGDMAHAHGKSFWLHFRSAYCSWQSDERGEVGFWEDMGTHVDGLQYQGDPGWDIGYLQSRLVDILRLFNNQGNRVKLRAFELVAARQFTQDHPNELDGDQIGYLSLCTKGDTFIWGFGGGARMPDGSFV